MARATSLETNGPFRPLAVTRRILNTEAILALTHGRLWYARARRVRVRANLALKQSRALGARAYPLPNDSAAAMLERIATRVLRALPLGPIAHLAIRIAQ